MKQLALQMKVGTNNSAMVDEQKNGARQFIISMDRKRCLRCFAEEEAKVMENIRNNVEGAREPLITHNLRLVVYIEKF